MRYMSMLRLYRGRAQITDIATGNVAKSICVGPYDSAKTAKGVVTSEMNKFYMWGMPNGKTIHDYSDERWTDSCDLNWKQIDD